MVDLSDPWRLDLEKLVDAYTDRSFTMLIQWYVFQNKWREDFSPHRNFDLFFYPDIWESKEKESPRRLFIEIYPSTTQEDIISNWDEIKKKQKELSKRSERFIRSRPNSHIEAEILLLNSLGIKSKEIADKIHESYGISYADSEIRALIIRAKKRSKPITAKS
jgi:hypothetical protein